MNRKFKKSGRFFVYILECNNGTFYTGITKDLDNRLKLHNSGRGAKYLRGKAPVKLVYCKQYKYFKSVMRAEREIKRLPRLKKQGLIRSFRG